MLTALVLVCSAVLTPDLADCNRNNAPTVIRVPGEFHTPATCFMQAQGYAASTSIGRGLDSDDRVKVICTRSEIVAASVRQR